MCFDMLRWVVMKHFLQPNGINALCEVKNFRVKDENVFIQITKMMLTGYKRVN